jgi:hypothetical protein
MERNPRQRDASMQANLSALRLRPWDGVTTALDRLTPFPALACGLQPIRIGHGTVAAAASSTASVARSSACSASARAFAIRPRWVRYPRCAWVRGAIMLVLIDQPTTRRKNKSSTPAT